jgi:hypothetical protein
MKKFLIFAVIAFITQSCTTRYLTEQKIKNEIQTHEVGKSSKIETYTIFKKQFYSDGYRVYLELTGCKYESEKILLIGADKFYYTRKNFKEDNSIIRKATYIKLNTEQCKLILDKYKFIQLKADEEKPKLKEDIYWDYTISEDLFISFKKSNGKTTNMIDFWIKGEKYQIPTYKIIKKIEKFIEY